MTLDLLNRSVGSGISLAKEFLYKNRDIKKWDCWRWTGLKRKGYGVILVGNNVISVHRLSWELYRGPIPDGLIICHRCDYKPCFNPEHLFLGTHQDNMDDMIAKRNAHLRFRRERINFRG